MSGNLLNYYSERRAAKRATRTQERRLGYAVEGIGYSEKRAEEFRLEGDRAMLAEDWEYAEECYRKHRAARGAASSAVSEALDRLSAMGR